LAATLALGAGAVISHHTAATLWEIAPAAHHIDVTVPAASGRRSRGALRVPRATLPERQRRRVSAIPCTTLVRTLLDLAAILDAAKLARGFEQAQVAMGHGRADLWFAQQRPDVETDDGAFHATAPARARHPQNHRPKSPRRMRHPRHLGRRPPTDPPTWLKACAPPSRPPRPVHAIRAPPVHGAAQRPGADSPIRVRTRSWAH
jgi:hypothetical protein